MTPTPKEQAKQLVNEYYSLISGMELNYISKLIVLPNGDSYYETAKMCAKKAVDELIKNSYFINELTSLRFKGSLFINPLTESKEHWQEVKKEIEKL